MGQALYRTHRPKKLSEVVGQEHITKTLEQALKQGRISHAYLFSGPRGTGKTSIARILAHEINGLPYADDASHIDIIEIDAASNRRIDEIRELRDKVHVAPTSSKYKVYIIDEVHMLTREAFNALLKTLEEPPAHVVFILATTDIHKLPETIISRTQRFSFKPADQAQALALLKDIAEQEKIQVSHEALELLAKHGQGSFRDSVSLLDQASSHGQKLDAENISQLLGIPPAAAVTQLVQAITDKAEPGAVVTNLNSLYDHGHQATAIAKQLAHILRDSLVENRPLLPSDQSLDLLSKLLEVPVAHDPERFLEIVLLSVLPTSAAASITKDVESEAVEEMIVEELEEPKPIPEDLPDSLHEETEVQPVVSPPTLEKTSKKAPELGFDEAAWERVLELLKQRHNTLYGVVRMTKPKLIDDQTVQLGLSFAFHQKRLNEAANRQRLEVIITEVMGRPITVDCVLDPTASTQEPAFETSAATSVDQSGDSLQTISNIFGNAELLES